jgi:hypothetical protein
MSTKPGSRDALRPGGRRTGCIALLISLSLCGAAGCATKPIYEVRNAPFPASSSVEDSELADLIRDAGKRQGWRIELEAPGRMRGAYTRGRHRAVVEIEYSASAYSITYRDSAFLKHDGDSIHNIYNVWVRELEAAIDREADFRLH